jgi:hypothetical protein
MPEMKRCSPLLPVVDVRLAVVRTSVRHDPIMRRGGAARIVRTP